jgi:predicted ATPase
VSRRRDVRRFGPGPYLLGLCRNETHWGNGFPYDVPAIAAIESVRLDAPVTLFAGDNGTGKSTLIEAIAEAIGFAAEGGELERSVKIYELGDSGITPCAYDNLDVVRLTRGFLDEPGRYVRAALGEPDTA